MIRFLQILGVSVATIVAVAIAIYVLLIIAGFKIFEKAGEAGWKSLIPFYNLYIQFKITWSGKMFWIFILVTILASVFDSLGDSQVYSILYGVFGLAEVVLYIMMNNKFAKAFGHGAGYTILLLFLPNIMSLILGFGKDKYVGPLSSEAAESKEQV